jgi:ferritin-like metal-binding protein YciE
MSKLPHRAETTSGKSSLYISDFCSLSRRFQYAILNRKTIGRNGNFMKTSSNAISAKASIGITRANPLYVLFLDELARMYDAEKQLTHALPLLVKVAHSDDLIALVKLHLKETEGHVKCIEQVAESLGEELTERKCDTMRELIKEGVKLVVGAVTSPELDTALIAGAQKIEHYEIASYRALCFWARKLGATHEVALLTSTLDQEVIADALLSGLAKGGTPLRKLVEKVSLKRATTSSKSVR